MPRKVRKVDSGLRWGEGYINTRIGPDGEMRYQARWPEGEGLDKTWRGKTFRTVDDAEDHLRDIARRKRDGNYQPETTMTVAQCVAEYLDKMREDWRPNTYFTATITNERQILPYLGNVKISELSLHRIQQWIKVIAKNGRRPKGSKETGPLAKSTVQGALSLLSASLRDAAAYGFIRIDPTIGAKALGQETPERPIWTPDEARRVLAFTSDDFFLHGIYCMAIFTGLRPGESRALRWQHVDLQRQTVAIRHTMTRDIRGREYVGPTTKTKRNRVVAIPEAVAIVLRLWRTVQTERRLAHPHWQDDDLVFDRGNGQFIPGTTMQRRHRRMIAATGVSLIRLHDIRHTFASFQAEAEVNPRVVMDAMGHRKLAITIERYTHSSMAAQATAAEGLARRLFGDGSDATTSGSELVTNG